MESNYDPMTVKNKFVSFIAISHDIGFTDDMISYKVVNHPFFNLFENNDIQTFLKTPLEVIIQTVFNKKEFDIDYTKPLISEYVWAASSYFSLLNEYHVPLERAFLIMPLGEMIKRFNPYHEMGSSALYQHYLKVENEIGVFNILKRDSQLSIREISFLTGINKNTLVSYSNNQKLFNASYENISLLSQIFGVKISIFKKTSSFHMLNRYQLEDKDTLDKMKKALVSYFGVDDNTLLVDTYKNNDELLEIGKKNKTFIYLPDFALVKYRSRLEYKFLKDNEINLLMNRVY